MDKTFNWINAKGMHITLTAKIESSRWIDVRYTASSPDFPDSYKNLEFTGSYRFVPDTLQLRSGSKNIHLAVPAFVKSELDAAIRQEFEANGFELEVNSTDGYGTYNGISGSALSYLEDYVGIPYSSDEFKFARSFNVRFGIDGMQFIPKSDSVNYRAFPICGNWRDEWKSYLTEAAKQMKAPGCIRVPAVELIAAYWETLAEVELPELQARIDNNEKRIAKYSGLTDQQARAREEAYNNVANEGGEGFVPHYVGSAERDYYVSQNVELRARISQIEKHMGAE